MGEASGETVPAAVVGGVFGAAVERRSVLDRAHRGDLEGAFGSVASVDAGPRRTLGAHLRTLLAVLGPGLVVMVADNDAGSFSVYTQAGQNYGLGLLWLFVLLAPVLYVLQEMAARLGAVTGAGHARLIFERFGRRWGAFALGDLLALNFLTLVTEFVGVDFAFRFFGVSRYVSVPLAAAGLVAVTATGRFRRWERIMLVLVLVDLAALPLVFLAHPREHALAAASSGAFDPGRVLFVVAVVGAAVSPWQLFFQQSNVVDKRITPRWLGYERVDTLFGALLFTVVGAAVVMVCGFAFDGTALHGHFVDLSTVTRALALRLGGAAGDLFALVLLNGSLLCAAVVTLTTSYALGDVLGVRHSLHRRWRDAPSFYGSFAAMTVLAAAIELMPGLPLEAVTTLVQALAAVLLPSATVFLLLLCNDRAVLGPWTNPRWLNGLAVIVLAILLDLSAVLTAATLFPHLDHAAIAGAIAAATVGGLSWLALASRQRSGGPAPAATRIERERWSMPPLETLAAPGLSRGRTIALVVLRGYLFAAACMLVVKAVVVFGV